MGMFHFWAGPDGDREGKLPNSVQEIQQKTIGFHGFPINRYGFETCGPDGEGGRENSNCIDLSNSIDPGLEGLSGWYTIFPPRWWLWVV